MTMEKIMIKADEQDLKEIGIDYNLNGLSGYLVKDYQTRWYLVEVDILIDGKISKHEFDIPSYMCIKFK